LLIAMRNSFVPGASGATRALAYHFSEGQEFKGEDDADWDVDWGRRLPWIECGDSGGRS
jgi:hypothetical protein